MESKNIDNLKKSPIRIASFGFRSLPPISGSAGADTFVMEFLPRLVTKGCEVVAYNRLYTGQKKGPNIYKGVKIFYFKTVLKSGFDSFLHSIKVTSHILFCNTADWVHIQGNNAIFGLVLKLFGKKVILSVDGAEWKREKWSAFMRKLVFVNACLNVYSSTRIVFDNVFTKELFEQKFKRKFDFISFGSETQIANDTDILERYGLEKDDYFLFVGRFIPDKGLQYLIPAFEKLKTNKKLVLVGGAPIPSEFEANLRNTKDRRIIFTGYIYGDDIATIKKNAYVYIQPSDIEGLSPVMLSVIGIGTPLICSDIRENLYIVHDDAYLFRKSCVNSLKTAMEIALEARQEHLELAKRGQVRILRDYSWDSVAQKYHDILNSLK